MAGPTFVKIRLWNVPPERTFGDDSNLLNLRRPVGDAHEYNEAYEVYWAGATQGGEELGTAADSNKDGTTTPFQITVVSASANDTDSAAGHVRKVALIGVSVAEADVWKYKLGSSREEYVCPELTVEVVNMNGTTDVLSTRFYTHLVHAYAIHWGSGGADAADDITIEAPANTDLQTIKGGQNDSNGCLLYFAPGHWIQEEFTFAGLMDAACDAGDGIMVTVTNYGFEHETNLNNDTPTQWLMLQQYTSYGKIDHIDYSPRLSTSVSYIKYEETLVGETRNGVVQIGVIIH